MDKEEKLKEKREEIIKFLKEEKITASPSSVHTPFKLA